MPPLLKLQDKVSADLQKRLEADIIKHVDALPWIWFPGI